MFPIFSNPAYVIAGGALISSPIIIHLINRMRFRRIRWAATEFLLKSQKRNRRRLIIEQLLLLLLRCLLIALAVMLVSQYKTGELTHERERRIVIVVDDTYSMDQQFAKGE